MKPLVKITSHPTIVQEIIGQFVFIILMSRPEDSNFKKLQELDINDVFKKADSYFIKFTDFEEMISDTDACNLTEKITEFLKEWAYVVDITAIQQNVHYRLEMMEKEFN